MQIASHQYNRKILDLISEKLNSDAMLRMEALRVFVIVTACGNIRGAADRLGRTPSAISMALKQLEEHLGAALFETDRKSTLSALGEEIHRIATDALRDHDQAIERIEAVAAGQQGRLQLAAVPSVAAQLLPAILTELLDDSPGIQIEIVDTDSTSVHTLVVNGTVELGIAGRPAASLGLEFVPLFHDPFRLVCRADHPLARDRRPVAWDDLRDLRVISNDAATAIKPAQYHALLAVRSLSARNVISLLALVRAGAGVTLLPALATVSLGLDLCALPLADPDAQREVGFILRQGRTPTPTCKKFQSRIKQTAAEYLFVQ